MYLARRDKEIGALLMPEAQSLLAMTPANLESALLARKLYNFTKSFKYTF